MRDLMRRFSGGLGRFLFGNRMRTLVLLASTLILAVGGFFVGMKTAGAASYCSVNYVISNQWPGGFGVQTITVTNTSGTNWTSWTLTWTFPAAGQAVTTSNGWNGNFSQSGQNVTVTNASYNATVANGASVNPPPGFNGTWTTSNPVPTNFAVNGNSCGGSGTPVPTATPTQSSGNTPTATPTQSSVNTPTPTPTQSVGNTPTPTATSAPTGPTATPCSGNCGRV